ncbi:hypothetical protein TheveDRAFT_1733 [Thermanaerovibrio velox DSM 12556]|uniref:DUF6305 domain-containing protein n=1 Tax=Thermanaerovibrio velox DSM 12556 TaxID=926567 RepID=H0UR14_9BACT|nr:DUF6305 family protein [Thermanaerovibrio velox]EHM10851.1 hypothetical protein TheveDRAFT_1733 [Thermanaerovibrio velox DSM 12556]
MFVFRGGVRRSLVLCAVSAAMVWGLCLGVSSALAAQVAVTSVGQSPDAMMVRVLLKKAGLECSYEAMMKPQDIQKDHKVLIAVVGGSMKGLGAAGIDKEQERDRVKELLDSARGKKVKILVMHVGGKGRRGELTDYLAGAAVPKADGVIVVKGGNDDGLMTKLAPKGVKVVEVEAIQAVTGPMMAQLSAWGVSK